MFFVYVDEKIRETILKDDGYFLFMLMRRKTILKTIIEIRWYIEEQKYKN